MIKVSAAEASKAKTNFVGKQRDKSVNQVEEFVEMAAWFRNYQ